MKQHDMDRADPPHHPTRNETWPTQSDPARRTVLRGILAAGGSLLLPASLLGCSKKDERVDTTSPSPEAAAPAAPAPEAPSIPPASAPPAPAPAESTAPGASAKVSQASVKYQTEPKGDQKCGNCMHFVAPNACKLVEGDISPNGWCVIWAKQA